MCSTSSNPSHIGFIIVVFCVILLTIIKAGEEIFVNCGSGEASLDIMLGLKKKVTCTNVDGCASIATIVVGEYQDDNQVPPFPHSCALSPFRGIRESGIAVSI